jgi:soluble lytic murein transglycosylase-like protein
MADSCQNSFFGIAKEELVGKLEAQDYGFLNSNEITRDNLRQAAAFGPGTLYYLSFIFRDLSKFDYAGDCLRIQWELRAAPYAALAASELAQFQVERGKYGEAESFAREALARDNPPLPTAAPAATPSPTPASAAPSPTPPSALSPTALYRNVRKAYVAALYYQKKDREVLSRITEFFPGNDEALLADDPEVFLYKAVSSGRLKLEGWNRLAMTLFLKLRRNPVHAAYVTFLAEEKGMLESFSRDEQEIIKAKAALAQDKFIDAASLYSAVFPRLGSIYFSGTTLLFDFGVSCVSGRPAAANVQLILAAAKKLEGRSYWEAIEQAAKVSQAIRDYATGDSLYRAVYEKSPDPDMKKRALWRILDIAMEAGGIDEKAVFAQFLPKISDPDYFTDVLEDLLTTLVRNKDFAALTRLAPVLQEHAPVWMRAKVSYLAGRAILQGQGSQGPGALTIPVKNSQAIAYFKDAISSWPQGYYALLSTHLLGEDATYKKQVSAKPTTHTQISEQESILLGYLKFGLYARAYALFQKTENEYPESFYSYFADQYGTRDRYFHAIQVLEMLRDKNPAALTEQDYRRLYPRAFQPLVKQFAELNGLDETLVFSLVRRESAFHPTIVSSAGAIGLAQLMPGTAKNIADILKMASYDMENPEDNLRFGTWFLADLKKKFATVPLILSGYNAGPVATKRFRDTYGNLPDDLFVEALDFAETRNFIKNIFINHVMYSVLYSDRTLKDSVAFFYRF